MTYTLSEQMHTMLLSLVCGAALGAVYDVLRMLRYVFRKSKAYTFLSDLLFMILCAFVTTLFSMGFTRGSTRYFTVLGELAGFLLVRLTVSRVSVPLFEKIYRFSYEKIIKISVIIGKNTKKLLQLMYSVLYNNYKNKCIIPRRRRRVLNNTDTEHMP